MNYIVVFFSQSGAIKFNKSMSKCNVECKLAPVPRKLSSSCGICAKIIYNGNINSLLEEEVESIYLVENSTYKLVHDSHECCS